jgi:hypothetical protein
LGDDLGLSHGETPDTISNAKSVSATTPIELLNQSTVWRLNVSYFTLSRAFTGIFKEKFTRSEYFKFGKNFRLTVEVDASAFQGFDAKLIRHIALQVYAVDAQ